MKRLIVLAGAVLLGGCASMPPTHRPMMRVVPKIVKAPVPVPAPAPVVVTPVPVPVVVPAAPAPGTPVLITKLGKPRWLDRFRSHFHKEDK